ncbi:MAG TPA: sigma 54-interacting transcriptional regulator [Burkholderiales bacterium]|nr:sigma 54-interacting transcriptional regulator [Burkholderiales bacterium]HYA47185.1 sigma 54-interacting transcriptional regulator [Burkholderiales bacterium]
MSTILLVDDDPDILKLVSLRLNAAGHGVKEAESGERALALLAAARPDLVITDLKMGGMDGLALFDEIRKQAPTLPVIILTAHGTIPDAVDATRRGVFAFQPKPFDGKHLLDQVEQALKFSGIVQGSDEDWRRDFVTQSPRMENVLHQARLVAQSEASVFLQGASGTGKELLARAIHRASRRSGGPFVAVNCAAIPENLLESELFGHRKGSFTGANYDHKGLIPSADQGTLFLDEIGDMPFALQAKLLRVLQDREVRAVGATQGTPVDVRIVSATHRDLGEQMRQGRFREDLYYRLNVVSLELPPLSERREDIVPLATHYLKATAARYGKDVQAFAPEALQLLLAAPWPGNVRQLVNVIEQVVALCASSLVPASLVQQALKEEPAQLASLEQARGSFEREYLIRILRITGGSVTRAAKLAQRNRTEFYKLLERHKLEPRMFKPEKV